MGREFGNVDLVTIPSEALEHSGVLNTTSPSPLPSSITDHEQADKRQADKRRDDERRDDERQDDEPIWSAEGVTHHPILSPGANFFDRVLSFRSQTLNWWRRRFLDRGEVVPIFHFRSIFEGYPIARQKPLFCKKLVFEVNGLPSIELKYRYPRVADDAELLEKIRQQEQTCLDAADLILTVSQVNAQHLVQRGVSPDRICVIPNGVDIEQFSYQSPIVRSRNETCAEKPMHFLYSGTMSPWQGVTFAIEALALFRRDLPARLTLVGHALTRQTKALQKKAYELGLYDHVDFKEPVSKPELAELHHAADAVIAPLVRNDRNLVQGCCPLKVLEAMSSGTPLVASDLPVVRELATDNRDSLLVRPGSAKSIKDALFRLVDEETLANRLSINARRHVEQNFTWARSQAKLIEAYHSLFA